MTHQVESAPKFQPPYMSWATFEGIIEGFTRTGIPDQIDRSVLSSRSGGDQSQFLRAASNFGLIDGEGIPTPRMESLVRDLDRRGEILKEILTESYPTVVTLGTGATQQQLEEAFRSFGIEGETVRKAIAFYINAAKQADIPLSRHFKATRPGAGGRRVRRSSPFRTKTSGNGAQVDPPPPPNPLGGLHPAILTLVQSLPRYEGNPLDRPEFSTADREAWFAYARATFGLIYTLPATETLPR
jgi:hypothetical protein